MIKANWSTCMGEDGASQAPILMTIAYPAEIRTGKPG